MNPYDIFKNLQSLQSRMGEMREKVKALKAEGAAGGDLVKVTVDGEMEALNVTIDPVAVDPRDVKMLEELVQAAFVDAVRKMKEVLKDEVGGLTADMGIPPGIVPGSDV